MLIIDGKEYKINEEVAYVGKHICNNVKGYNINFEISFNDGEDKGYLYLNVGFEKEKDINLFLNKKFTGFNFGEYPFMFLEVCHTKKYLDSEIESEITVEIKDLTDEKIGVSINVDDDLIKIKYEENMKLIERLKCQIVVKYKQITLVYLMILKIL